MAGASRFRDLGVRFGSALVLLAGAAAAFLAGPPWVLALVCVATGAMIWEIARLFLPGSSAAVAIGALGAAAVAVSVLMPGGAPAVAALVIVPALGILPRLGPRFTAYGGAVVLAGWTVAHLYVGPGPLWVLWLVALVVAADVAAYFAGRLIGGPKFWPRISPKKTWSGTVAGWLLAAAIGLGFVLATGAPAMLVAVSVLLAFAGQMGDIAESAIKRRVGVKDSSALIPGHGGVLDRFDALIAVAMLAHLLALAGLIPALPVAGAG